MVLAATLFLGVRRFWLMTKMKSFFSLVSLSEAPEKQRGRPLVGELGRHCVDREKQGCDTVERAENDGLWVVVTVPVLRSTASRGVPEMSVCVNIMGRTDHSVSADLMLVRVYHSYHGSDLQAAKHRVERSPLMFV